MENIESLIEEIKKCDLSSADKDFLIEKLDRKKPDVEGFLRKFLIICEISKEILELFEIDIGSIL